MCSSRMILLIVCGLAVVSPARSKESADSPLVPNEIATQNGEISSDKGTEAPRTLGGLLGLLAGLRLGQGSQSPSSYNPDDNHFDLVAKFLNGVFRFTFEKIPYQQQYVSYPPFYSPYTPYAHYQPNPQNIFPMNLQPPLWYPPIFSPQNPDKNNNGNNIVKPEIVHIDDKIKENGDTIQDVTNITVEPLDNDEITTTETPLSDTTAVLTKSIAESNDTESKNTIHCDTSISCKQSVESDIEVLIPASSDTPLTIKPNTTSENINHIQPTTLSDTLVNTSITTPSTSHPEAVTTPASGLTVSPTDASHPSRPPAPPPKYPYPVYYYYGNHTKYENVSITETPQVHPHFLTAPDYYEDSSDNDFPALRDGLALPSPGPAQAFRPMKGNYYDATHGFETYEERFNKKLEDSDFVPMKSMHANQL